MEPFVSPSWLSEHRDEVLVADVRWYLDGRSGREAYEQGHTPGAVFIDLDADLAARPGLQTGRHPLPSPEDFALSMAAAGIGDGCPVVAYDDAGGVTAARLVWMLRALGHPAAVLDGGLSAYDGRLEGEAERAARSAPPARFTPRPWPAERLASLENVAHPDGARLIDARDPARFRGEQEPVDPRPGHIPGAVNLPARENVDRHGCLLPEPELRERLQAAQIADGSRVISYCGSGVSACHNLLVLEQLGLGQGRLYPGSWSQYSADPSRPAALG